MVTEAPGLRGPRGLGEPAGIPRLVRALAIAPQRLEDPRQRALPHLARAPGRHLQPAAAPLHQPGLLQRALDLLQPSQVLRGGLAQGAPQRLLVDVVERGARILALHRPVELLVVVQTLHRVDRGRHRHRPVPVSEDRVAPGHLRERAGEVRAQPVDLEREVHVLHHLLGQRLQLPALLVRERCHQAAHRRHASRHLLEELVEGPRVVREEVAVPLHERLEARLRVLAAVTLLDQRVQVGEHVAEPREVLGRHVLHPLRHVPEVRAQDVLAQLLHQLVELPLRLRVGEAVLLELADLAGRVGGERVEERLAHPRVVLVAEGQRGALALQDLLELLPHVLERPGEVERVLLALALLLQPAAERVEAAEAPLHPPSQQALERGVGAAAHQDLVGELLEDVARRDLGPEGVLGAVPSRVADAHATSLRRLRRRGVESQLGVKWRRSSPAMCIPRARAARWARPRGDRAGTAG